MGRVFEGFIITIPLLVESFGLKVTSDFTNFHDSKIIVKCFFHGIDIFTNNSVMVFV